AAGVALPLGAPPVVLALVADGAHVDTLTLVALPVAFVAEIAVVGGGRRGEPGQGRRRDGGEKYATHELTPSLTLHSPEMNPRFRRRSGAARAKMRPRSGFRGGAGSSFGHGARDAREAGKPMRTQAVFLFDLDGTLVDSVYQHVLAWKEAID